MPFVGQLQKQFTYSCILKVTGEVWEIQKRISIDINYSYQQHLSSYLSLSSCNNSDSVLIIGKDGLEGWFFSSRYFSKHFFTTSKGYWKLNFEFSYEIQSFHVLFLKNLWKMFHSICLFFLLLVWTLANMLKGKL